MVSLLLAKVPHLATHAAAIQPRAEAIGFDRQKPESEPRVESCRVLTRDQGHYTDTLVAPDVREALLRQKSPESQAMEVVSDHTPAQVCDVSVVTKGVASTSDDLGVCLEDQIRAW